MKKLLTNNFGLKILSVLAAIILWIIVVNVDNPVITRTYTGIPVEIINSNAITDEGKTYEVADGSDTISVAISAERSIIEALTKDNIKATADMKNITFMNTVPIETKTTRYAEKIESISSRNSNLSVIIENKKTKQLKLTIIADGKVANGYIQGSITPVVDVVKVSGPESKVNKVYEARINVDFADMNESFTSSSPVVLYDRSGNVIDDESITVSQEEVRTSIEILETKEIPVTAYFVGVAANGYDATGTVICDPSSVVVAGNGSAFDKLSSIKIPDERISIDGAVENAEDVINIKEYLPKGVVLADAKFNGDVNVVTVIEPHDSMFVELPVSKISVVNLPENYTAHVVSGDEKLNIEVTGLSDNLLAYMAMDVTAQIDASALAPRVSGEDFDEDAEIYTGPNDGAVLLDLPAGVTQVTNVTLEVIINYHENNEKTEE